MSGCGLSLAEPVHGGKRGRHIRIYKDEATLHKPHQSPTRGIAFLPFFPLAIGGVSQGHRALAAIAQRHGASEAQIALAWLLARSPVMLPIPGTGSMAHLEENWDARRIALSPQELAELAG